MAYEPPIFDQYTALDFKSALGGDGYGPRSNLAPTWIGKENQRRLRVYTVLQAYLTNSSRHLLDRKASGSDARREYGDADNIVSTFVSAVLGDEQEIHVEGAEDYEEDSPSSEATAAFELQEKLREWGDQERLSLKMIEAENKAVGLGDGVYALGWDTKKKRPRLRVRDPGFYFPVLDDNDDDFPRRVHIAWELDEDDNLRTVRRITYELRTVDPYSVPWSDEPIEEECFMSDGVWKFGELTRSVDDFKESAGRYMEDEEGLVRNRALGIDFIPIVHVPNTPSTEAHFGTSVLSLVLQILDDLQEADTDKAKASAVVATPFLGIAGARIDQNEGLVFGPGSYIEMAENGKLFPVDLSAGLERIATHIEELQKRLSVNVKLPDAARGRVDSSEIESGIHLLLLYSPMKNIVRAMRLVRDEKYPLLLKFVQRFYMLAGELEGPEQRAEIVFGSFMPNDETASVELVVKLLQAGAISLETAVLMLMEAGLPIEDVAEEVRKIQERDFEGAADLLAATGNEKDVADYLGREVSTVRPPAPPIDLDLPEDEEPPEEDEA